MQYDLDLGRGIADTVASVISATDPSGMAITRIILYAFLHILMAFSTKDPGPNLWTARPRGQHQSWMSASNRVRSEQRWKTRSASIECYGTRTLDVSGWGTVKAVSFAIAEVLCRTLQPPFYLHDTSGKWSISHVCQL